MLVKITIWTFNLTSLIPLSFHFVEGFLWNLLFSLSYSIFLYSNADMDDPLEHL